MTTEINQPETNVIKPKKRVLFVITQSELGGAQQFLVQLITHLDKNRFDCSVVVGADGGGDLKHLLPANTNYIVASRLKRSFSAINDTLSLFELHSIYRTQKPDIIFLNSSKAGFNGSLAASRLFGRPTNALVIYRIGGWSFNDPQSALSQLFRRTMERLSAGWKDYIVVNNTHDLETARRHHIRPRKEILMIHNGIDPYAEYPDRATARVKLLEILTRNSIGLARNGTGALFKAEHLIGTIANFYRTKGLEFLVQAATRTPDDTIFVVIGDGQLRPELEQLIEKLGLTRRVYLAGQLPNAAQYLPAFDIFVLPSVKEGFPWSVLEAIIARVPVIATTVGAIPEIIEHGKNGILIKPRSAEVLATEIVKLLANPDNLREMPIQAHQKLLQSFALRQMIGRYEQLFSTAR